MSWTLFKQYSRDMANEVLRAFERKGYTGSEADAMAELASRDLPHLPAHGTGGTDSGVQGNYERVSKEWKSKLIAYAQAHPKPEAATPAPGTEKRQTPREKQATDTRKAQHKESVANTKHLAWHNKNPMLNCHDPGCPENKAGNRTAPKR